jgi:hypothetical protein
MNRISQAQKRAMQRRAIENAMIRKTLNTPGVLSFLLAIAPEKEKQK